MPIPEELRQQVRERARFACEYCGVSEMDAGGELTLDHFQPQGKGGGDELENLVYCCARCNWHKSDYWPVQPAESWLWNPRREPFARHFLVRSSGVLQALTPVGVFTLQRLQLNRAQLVARRRRAVRLAAWRQLLAQRRDFIVECVRELRESTTLDDTQQRLLQELLELIEAPINGEENAE